MRIRSRHYATGRLVDVLVDKGLIQAINSIDPSSPPPDLTFAWIAPGLFDLQINGAMGIGFSSKNLAMDGVRRVVDVCQDHGITGLLPTLVTNSHEALVHGFSTLARSCETDPVVQRAVPGFHLEGPYISPEDGPRGAHAKQHVRSPNWNEFCEYQNAAGGRIKLVTLAPEVEGAIPFIEQLSNAGVVVSLGHTAATSEVIRTAIAAGARLSTHLGNGSHAVLPRHGNYIWEQAAADQLWASLICDGHHLPPSVIRCLIRCKTTDRLILTCDASSLAGLPPGRYREWDQDFEVLPGGKVIVPGTVFLAGSGVFLDACLGPAMDHGGLTLEEAIDLAGARPRQLLGLPPVLLEPGMPADLILFDWQPGQPVQVHQTLVGGVPV